MDVNKRIRYFKVFLVLVFVIILGKFFLVTNYFSAGYSELAKYQTDVIIKNPMPRGEIFDRNDKLIVGNKQSKNLVYMSTMDISNDYEWEVAQKLVSNIDVDKITYDFKEIDYQDLIIRENSDEIYDRVNDNPEKYKDMEDDEALRSAVTQEDINEINDTYGEGAVKLKILMNASSTSSPKVLFEDLSIDEQYYIESNFNTIGGAFIINSWEREYPYGETLRNFLGTVGEIPKEEQQKYLNLGYSPSDKVGTSYVEYAQEQYLKSSAEEIQIFFDSEGNIIDYKTLYEGEVGKDLKLTIDIELQKDIEKILRDNLKDDSYENYKANYASVMDVNTGDIIALAGQFDGEDGFYDNSIGNFSGVYEVGSIVKPAVLLTGYQEGVWEYGQVVNDKPMDIGGGITKASYHNYGMVDENKAIAVSSNVYFYTMALKIAGIEYGKDPLPQTIDEESFNTMRENFAKFGLGVKTGIGFDEEIEGVKSNDNGVGLYMDIANGQYDTYTPLQMTQYMSTIANGKSRYKANYIYSINEPGNVKELGKEVIRVKPVVLNQLDYSPKDIKHVQETLILPSQGGGTTAKVADSRYKFGSKSGTSESFYYEPGMKKSVETNNTSFIAYAPYDKPNVAISVMMPYWTSVGETNKTDATDIGGQVLDATYDAGYI